MMASWTNLNPETRVARGASIEGKCCSLAAVAMPQLSCVVDENGRTPSNGKDKEKGYGEPAL